MKLSKTYSLYYPHGKTTSVLPFPQLRFNKSSFARFKPYNLTTKSSKLLSTKYSANPRLLLLRFRVFSVAMQNTA